MSNLRIDYSGIAGEPGGARSAKTPSGGTGEGRRRPPVSGNRGADSSGRKLLLLPFRLLRWGLLTVILTLLPFLLLIRGGVFAYQQWGLGVWPSLAASAFATLLLLALYAWAASRRIGAGKGLKWLMTRGAAAIAIAYVAYSLLYVGGANVKSEEVRAEYAALHPLLRVAASTLILADPGSVITDAGRTPDFYRRMGLSPNESSLHFKQDNGFVHALDLRTIERPEWRNRAVELSFWAMGFHSLRHKGTADHLHVSLRLPG